MPCWKAWVQRPSGLIKMRAEVPALLSGEWKIKVDNVL